MAVAELSGLLVKLRSRVEQLLGATGLALYGLVGRVPAAARRLRHHADNALSLLAKHPRQIPGDFGGGLDTAAAVASVGPKRDALVAALEAIDREARELEDALTKRDEALESWTDTYQGVADTLTGLLRIGGFDELSDCVRPTVRRMSGEDDGADLEPAAAPSAGAAGDDAPSDEAASTEG